MIIRTIILVSKYHLIGLS